MPYLENKEEKEVTNYLANANKNKKIGYGK